MKAHEKEDLAGDVVERVIEETDVERSPSPVTDCLARPDAIPREQIAVDDGFAQPVSHLGERSVGRARRGAALSCDDQLEGGP